MSSKLISFYKQILTLGSLTTDKDGLVSAKVDDMTVPFTVKGKRMALPTRENMNKSIDLCIFHPLTESFSRGESDVMQKFRHAINTRLNYVIGCIMGELLTLITSPGEHHKLNPEQSELLSLVHQADEETLNRFNKITESIKKSVLNGDKDKVFVNIYLKKSAQIKGKIFKRGAIVSFPFYEELLKKEKSVYGVTLRNKDRDAIQKLMEFIVPGIGEKEGYNQGSNSDIGPFLDALLKGTINVASNINEIAKNYGDFLGMKESYIYNEDWIDTMENIVLLEPEIRMIPMQAGNEGSIQNNNVAPNNQQQLSVAPHNPQQYTQPAPQYNQSTQIQPVQASANKDPNKVSFSDLDRNRQIQQPINNGFNQNVNAQAWGLAPQNNPWQQFIPQPMSGPAAARANISSLSVLASGVPYQQNNGSYI